MVAEEMRQLKYDFGAEHLWFADDIFGLRPKWVRELANEVETSGRRDSLQDAVARGPDDARTTFARCAAPGAPKSGWEPSRDRRRFWTPWTKALASIRFPRLARTCGTKVFAPATFCNSDIPARTWQDIQNTIKLVRDTRPDDIGVSVSYPLPGTKFYERVQAQLGEKTNWSDSEDMAMMFQGAYTNEFYRALHDALHAQVDLWNSYPATKP